MPSPNCYIVRQNGVEVFRGTKDRIIRRFNVSRYRVETNKMEGYTVEKIEVNNDPIKEQLDRIEARLNEYGNTVFPVMYNKKINYFLNELEKRGHKLNVRWGSERSLDDPVKAYKRKKKVYAILEEL